MTASTDGSFAFDQPLLSGGRHFSTGDYHVARRFVERTTRGLFDFSLPSVREFRQYDVRSAQLGETLFSLVMVDSVSGYDIEMMDDPDLVLLHILMRGNAQLQQGPRRWKWRRRRWSCWRAWGARTSAGMERPSSCWCG